MFKRNKAPERKAIDLTPQQMGEDIRTISDIEEQRNMLYYCLDENPPHDNRFSRVEEFLKGNSDLETASTTLKELTEELEKMKDEMKHKLGNVKINIESILKNVATVPIESMETSCKTEQGVQG